MSNSPLIFPSDELAHLVQRRSEIWQIVDGTRNEAQKIEELGHNLGNHGTASSLPALVNENNPRAEIFSVHQQLKEELDKISEANHGIEHREASIKQMQTQRQTLIIVASVIGFIFLCFLLNVVF